MRLSFRTLAAASLALTSAAPAAASVTVGTGSIANCFPVSCLGTMQGVGTVYQQVYAASAFGGADVFGGVELFRSSTSTSEVATYNIAFYLTSATVNGLSTVSAAANRGTLLADFGNFTIGGANQPSTIAFNGPAFAYDPAAGNLLMQVTVTGLTAYAPSNHATLRTAYNQASTSRVVFNPSGVGTTLQMGAVTRFVTAVPEPTTWAMMIGGFGMVGASLRRRRSITATLKSA